MLNTDVKIKACRVYLSKESLGRGGFGEVYKIQMPNQETFAAKIIYSDINKKSLQREFEIMNKCSHKNIVEFFATCTLSKRTLNPVFVMELMETYLEKYCCTKKPSFQCTVAIQIQVAEGLQYLHEHNPKIVHRDLTAPNVLLKGTKGESESIVAKIADFGLSRIVDTVQTLVTMTRLPGTPYYLAPEVDTKKHRYNEKIDIFSFGHLALVSSLGKVINEILDIREEISPLSEIERRRVHFNELHDKLKEETDYHECCREYLALIKSCLELDPKDRPIASAVITDLSRISESLSATKSSDWSDLSNEERAALLC